MRLSSEGCGFVPRFKFSSLIHGEESSPCDLRIRASANSHNKDINHCPACSYKQDRQVMKSDLNIRKSKCLHARRAVFLHLNSKHIQCLA